MPDRLNNRNTPSGETAMPTRRRFVQGLTFAAAAASSLAGHNGAALAQTISPLELGVQGPLGDVVLGNPDAKATVIEYASLTCSHCANFHEKVWPQLKAKYIDTGKIRFILREFPLDPLATAGFMLARCLGNEKYYPVVDLLFSTQKTWAFSEKPVEALATLMKQAGYSQESFEACLKNQKIYEAVNEVRDRGAKTFGVQSTPTFFVNGEAHRGALGMEEFDKLLGPLVGG
jgi:protein-disulfide isomerase